MIMIVIVIVGADNGSDRDGHDDNAESINYY